jgi:hypothetical protein
MDSSYEDAVTLLRKWKLEGSSLWVDFWEPGETNLQGKCFISELTDEGATLAFGCKAKGTLTIALQNAMFTYLAIANAPPQIRANLENLFVGWLEIKYPFWGDGCRISEFITRS